MSIQMTNSGSDAPQDTSPATTGTAFTLSATNGSTVPGVQYFNVFPPALKSPSAKFQILTALVSDPTPQTGKATMTWNGGGDALTLFALVDGKSPINIQGTPVALGDTVAVAWADGAFTVTPATGGPPGAIEVTFAPGVPVEGQIGLVVGPAPILVPIPIGLSPVTLEPDLSPTVTVNFGTAFQLPKPDESDLSKAVTITFVDDPSASPGPAFVAQIKVGLDNQIVEVP